MIWTHQPSPGLPSMHGTFTDGLSLSFYFSVSQSRILSYPARKQGSFLAGRPALYSLRAPLPPFITSSTCIYAQACSWSTANKDMGADCRHIHEKEKKKYKFIWSLKRPNMTSNQYLNFRKFSTTERGGGGGLVVNDYCKRQFFSEPILCKTTL